MHYDEEPALFPAVPRPRRRASPLIATLAIVSTCAALMMAVYIAVSLRRSPIPTEAKRSESVVEAQPAIKSTPVTAPDVATEVSAPPPLPRPALNLSRQGDSDYHYDLTLRQLRASFPSVTCTVSEGEPGQTCFLSTASQLAAACAFKGCLDEMIFFDEEGRFSAVSSSVDDDIWFDMKRAVSEDGGVNPRTSRAAIGSTIEDYTCFPLTNGALKFALASGQDVYGHPIARPYTIFFDVGATCAHMPGQATSG